MTNEEKLARLKSLRAELEDVDRRLQMLDGIDLEADDAVRRYVDGLGGIAEDCEAIRKEIVGLIDAKQH